MTCEDLLLRGRLLQRKHGIPDIRRKAELRIADNGLRSVAVVELFVQACQKHHGELQAFGLVDRQDPDHAAAPRGGSLPEVPVVFLQCLNIAHEIIQSPVTGLLKVRRF